jgi:YfiH family protein
MRTVLYRDAEGWELPLLVSDLIPAPFRHGFTARGGGVSAPPFETLNLGGKWGDARVSVDENRRRVERAAGAGALRVATQVHGADVARLRAGDAAGDVGRLRVDGLCSDAADLALGVYVADCIPALLADPRTGAFAAVHAGWRGTVAGVLPAAARALGELGARPEDLRVALGPAIGPCCFEVGPEVVAAFEAALPGAREAGVVLAAGGGRRKPHIDLKRANVLALERAGVPAASIDAGPECTACDRERFFSFRRDGGQTGQHVGFIARFR